MSPVAFSAAAGANRVYAWSLWWFFVALFSKQNTITMLPAIVAFDLIVAGRPVRFSWSWIRPYLPFAVLTVGFLALRYILLGEVVRESQLSSQRFAEFSGILARHLQRMIWGDLGTVPDAVRGFAAGYAILTILALVRVDASTRRSAIRVALYFGLVWIALGLAPTVAAGYESPRHAYLAAPGWTIMIGLAFDLLRAAAFAAGNPPSEALRRAQLHAISIGTITVLTLYGVRLHREVTDWRLRAAVAHAGVIELERQVLAAPEGTLFLVSVPVSSWEWGAPFVAKPPYASTDLTARADIVVPERLHCCRGRWWDAETRGAIDRWLQRRTPIVALYASAGGEIRRLTDSEAADLRVLVESLRDIRSTGNLDGAIQDILRKLVAGRGQIVRAAIDR